MIERGAGLAWVGATVLLLSSFMGWYSGSDGNLTYSVLAWNTGALGKLIFFIGLAVIVLLALRAVGFLLPASIPTGMVVAGLGALATVFVLIRLIDIPEDFAPASGRSIGLWISLLAALLLILAGLLEPAEEA